MLRNPDLCLLQIKPRQLPAHLVQRTAKPFGQNMVNLFRRKPDTVRLYIFPTGYLQIFLPLRGCQRLRGHARARIKNFPQICVLRIPVIRQQKSIVATVIALVDPVGEFLQLSSGQIAGV